MRFWRCAWRESFRWCSVRRGPLLLKASVCHRLDGGGVFGRRHSGDLFELSGKVVDGGVAQLFGDLGEIVVVVPDHLFGGVDLQCGEILDDALAAFVTEDLLELGASDQVVPADLVDRDVGVDVALQVACHAVEDLAVAPALGCLRRLPQR